MQFEFTGVEASHFSGVTDELIQAVALLVDDGEKFVRLVDRWPREWKKASDRNFDGSERSAEVVSDGVEERGFELLPFPGSFGFSQVFDGAGAFEGDGDHRAEGLESLGGEQAAGNGQAADRTGTHANGNE